MYSGLWWNIVCKTMYHLTLYHWDIVGTVADGESHSLFVFLYKLHHQSFLDGRHPTTYHSWKINKNIISYWYIQSAVDFGNKIFYIVVFLLSPHGLMKWKNLKNIRFTFRAFRIMRDSCVTKYFRKKSFSSW